MLLTHLETAVEGIRTVQLDIPPGMIEFGAGQPSPGLLPLALLKDAAAHRLSGRDLGLLAYGAEQGDGYFRLALAKFLSEHYQIEVSFDDLFITAGASQGLDLISTLFSRPGDTIFVEEPTYFLALRIFADHGLNVVSLPMDENGLIVEALEEKLSRHSPVFLYTIPTFHNPSSATLAAERRERLVQLSRRFQLLIVADEVYHMLSYSDAPPKPLASHIDSSHVLSLGSFSKIMAPGLRLGWIQGGTQLLQRFTGCGLLDSGGGLNPFTSGIMRSAIENGRLENQLKKLKAAYSQRKTALVKALRDKLPETVRFVEPGGGFFIWLEFQEGIDTNHLLAAAVEQNVGFLPGVKFSAHNGLKNFARLSFSYYEVPQLEEGAGRLGKVIREFMKEE
ncbi:MAG: PLP-dependent aminotransferase family protein [Desulfobacterales bacterium]|nr:MAG: PLP-dependent aminotransferase family protein [Desulfobacterales bacterium]